MGNSEVWLGEQRSINGSGALIGLRGRTGDRGLGRGGDAGALIGFRGREADGGLPRRGLALGLLVTKIFW